MREMSLIEVKLWDKAKQAVKELQGVREPRIEGDIFTRRYYISPQDLLITNYPRTQSWILMKCSRDESKNRWRLKSSSGPKRCGSSATAVKIHVFRW
jgi:hypothetical protein